MIHPHMLFARHEQKWFLGMKTRQLRLTTLGLTKRLLTRRLAYLMDKYSGRPSFGTDSDKVVALAMPSGMGAFAIGA